MTVNQPDMKYCTQDPRCQGPRLIDNHKALCPFENGDDCDNDQCWIGCPYCSTESADVAAPRH